MELALQEALDAGRIKIPVLVVDFSEHDPTGDIEADEKAERLIDTIGKVTSLQVPHRLADAILRDSQFGGIDFLKSDRGKALNTVSLANATSLFGPVESHMPNTRAVGQSSPCFPRLISRGSIEAICAC